MAEDTLWISELKTNTVIVTQNRRATKVVGLNISVSLGQESTVTIDDMQKYGDDFADVPRMLSIEIKTALAEHLVSVGGERFGVQGVELIIQILKSASHLEPRVRRVWKKGAR